MTWLHATSWLPHGWKQSLNYTKKKKYKCYSWEKNLFSHLCATCPSFSQKQEPVYLVSETGFSRHFAVTKSFLKV